MITSEFAPLLVQYRAALSQLFRINWLGARSVLRPGEVYRQVTEYRFG